MSVQTLKLLEPVIRRNLFQFYFSTSQVWEKKQVLQNLFLAQNSNEGGKNSDTAGQIINGNESKK